MIRIRITGRGSYVLQAAIAKMLRDDLGLSVAEYVDTRPAQIANIGRHADVRGKDVLITIAERKP